MRLRPPITYYGGKQKLVKELLPLIPKHGLYIEPFMGGGALFFGKEPSAAEIINDLNGNVTNFYRVVQSQFHDLKNLVDGTLHSRATHQEAMQVYKNPAGKNGILRAWAFWVVTNQGFAGKIGSWALSRDSKVGKTLSNKREGFTKVYAERLRNVQVESKDALDIIEQYDRADAFFYLDPPYFNSNCGHYKGYMEADYKKLLDALTKIKGKFLLSSYPSAILCEYVKKQGWYYKEIVQRIRVTRLTNKTKTEVLVCNYDVPSEPVKEAKNNKPSLTAVQKNNERCKQVEDKKVALPRKYTSPASLHVAAKVLNFDERKESPNEKKQLSLEYCKRVLEKSGAKYTDEEVLKIRQLLYKVGHLEYQLFKQLKTRHNGKHNPLRKGKHGRTGRQGDKYPLPKRKAGAIL